MDTFEKTLLTLGLYKKEIFEEGTANLVYRYGPSFVVREKKTNDVDLPFQTNATEKEAYSIIGNLNIVPEVLFLDDNGNKIERFIEGRYYEEGNKEDLAKIASALKRLHFIPIAKDTTAFKPLERLAHYKNAAKESIDLGLEEEIITKATPILTKGPYCLCHNDLWRGNILINQDKAYLIDLEFASASNPLFDLASFIEENSLDEEDTLSFLTSYFGRLPIEEELEEVNALINFHHLLWYYWANARFNETKNPKFKEIAKEKEVGLLSIKEKEV